MEKEILNTVTSIIFRYLNLSWYYAKRNRMKIFMTGSTGFVGSHLINQLHSSGHEVTAMYRENQQTRIPVSKQPVWLQCQMDKITADDLRGHDVLLTLAAAGMPNNPEKVSFDEMFYWNVTALIGMIDAAREANVKKIVICSTFKEYGDSAAKYDFIPTNAPLLPTTPFACSRVAGYMAALAYAQKFNISIEYVRFFNLYGDGENALDLWTAIKNAALAGEDLDMTPAEQVRDYTDVKDAVLQLNKILELPMSNTLRVHHIASGQPIVLKDFADYWWEHWNARGKINYGALSYRTYESMRIVGKK
jgi:nucleoside-diphosphate-sugar epimerase